MIRALAILALLATASGAFYEWGGPARRGVHEVKKKQYDEALRDLAKGRADFPGSAVVPYDEGVAHSGRGAADSAAARFQEATLLSGTKPREAAHYNLGNLAMRAQDYAGAARSYREALRLDPRDGDAKRNLEEALRAMRQAQAQQNPSAPPSGGKGPRTPQGNQSPQMSPSPGSTPTPPPRGSSGAFTKDEAERWLEALESERRAKRQEGKGQPTQENGNRDW